LGASSLHVLFPTPDEQVRLTRAGLHRRKGCQFHWHNADYASFDEFLDTFASAKRKKARRERRRIAEAGIGFDRLRGDELTTAEWDTVYEYYSRTFLRRGRLPYLNREFFAELSRTMPEDLLVVVARFERRPIASAICFRSRTTLFGRYWGCLADFHSLHFETCYYQGIEHCIEHKLERFEPGTQGEHKISRGFVPTATWSNHWLSDLDFNRALEDLLVREETHVDSYMRELQSHLPYKHVTAHQPGR
jgi:predicted N-acyltransferase